MKPFKETKVGMFLAQKAPGILDAVGDVFPPAKILSVLYNSMAPDIPEADRLEFERLLKDYELNELKAYLEDVQNARAMQIAALNQDDLFSKRFIYYLATLVIAMVFVFNMCMFFVHYPPENRDMINQTSGILNSGALIMILSFFFGTSKSSADKQKKLDSLIT